MEDSTPTLMTVEEFNNAVKVWRMSRRREIVRNTKTLFGGKGKDGSYTRISDRTTFLKLSRSIKARSGSDKGIVDEVKFNFARHGVFLHYGVGRGYKKVKGSRVVSRVKKNKAGSYNNINGSIKRHPVDWFDVVIRRGVKDLADTAQRFYGDQAMRDILNDIDKYLIEKNGK